MPEGSNAYRELALVRKISEKIFLNLSQFFFNKGERIMNTLVIVLIAAVCPDRSICAVRTMAGEEMGNRPESKDTCSSS